MKTCPVCTKDLPLEEFGTCKARKDGHNLYCKACIRVKVTAHRIQAREIKRAQKEARQRLIEFYPSLPNRKPSQMSVFRETPIDKVRRAINLGCGTWDGIKSYTKLTADEIGDPLAILLSAAEIRIVNRVYLPAKEVQRYESGPAWSYSNVPELYPRTKSRAA